MSKHGAVTHIKSVARPLPRLLTTDELADLVQIQADSIRKRFHRTGAYYCLRHIKLPNGRLRWPADSLEQLSKGA